MATKKSAAQKKSELLEIIEPEVTETPSEVSSVEEAPVEEAPVEESPVEEIPLDEAPVEVDNSHGLKNQMDKTCCELAETCGECLYAGHEEDHPQAKSVISKSYISGLADSMEVSDETVQRAFERFEAMQAWKVLRDAPPKPARLNFWLKQGAEIIIEASEICAIVVRDGYPETLVLRGGQVYDLATSVGLHAAKATVNRIPYKTWLEG